MEIRLARVLAIAVVVVVLGGLLLSGRAKKLERRLVAAPPGLDTVSAGPPDSARAVALSEYAYRTDHAARGEAAVLVRVVAFSTDTAGFLLELAPRDSGPGTRALVRVLASGQVELRRLAP